MEKEVLIHDLLCKAVVYDSEFDRNGENTVYTAYGALVNGHAVCEGYARAFKLLCYYAGLECILVTGDSKGVGHMWNMVRLDGNWYHVDATWDDLRSEPHHTYLNLTELQINMLKTNNVVPLAFQSTAIAYSEELNNVVFEHGNGCIDFSFIVKIDD